MSEETRGGDFPLPYLSPSQVNCYLRCPAEYYLKYLCGISMPSSSAMTKGKAVHAANEVNFKQKIESRTDLPLADVLDVAATEFERMTPETEFTDKEEPGKAKDSAIKLAELYYKQFSVHIQPIAVEEKVEFNLEGLEIPILGYIDLIDEDYHIRDTKTTAKTPSEDMVRKSLQLTAYVLGFRDRYGTTEAGVSLDYLIATKEPKAISYPCTRTEDDIRRFKRTVLGVAGNIKNKAFYPNPSSMMCSEKSCKYWTLCQTML